MKTTATRAPVGLCALVLLAACGGEPAPVAPPAPTEAPVVTPAPTASATAEATPPAPSAKPSGSAATDMPPPPKQSSGRPMVLMADPVEITGTFGSSPGAKIELGDKEKITLRIPEFSLSQRGTIITIKIDPKGKANGSLIGRVLHITTFEPKGTPEAMAVEGAPLELQMPAGNKKNANLAIGAIGTDEKDHEKIVWKVIAPKRIDDVAGIAYFELMALSDSYVHVTAKPPTPAK
jgi:hypothetical protein